MLFIKNLLAYIYAILQRVKVEAEGIINLMKLDCDLILSLNLKTTCVKACKELGLQTSGTKAEASGDIDPKRS
uniref:SAP domain-containing protein n=1 Tax=Strongyloides venezuelensis TaxID=75913 RepID=A0A0K0G5M7_STRVS